MAAILPSSEEWIIRELEYYLHVVCTGREGESLQGTQTVAILVIDEFFELTVLEDCRPVVFYLAALGMLLVVIDLSSIKVLLLVLQLIFLDWRSFDNLGTLKSDERVLEGCLASSSRDTLPGFGQLPPRVFG